MSKNNGEPLTELEKYLLKQFEKIVSLCQGVNFSQDAPTNRTAAAILGKVQGIAEFSIGIQNSTELLTLFAKSLEGKENEPK